MSSQSELLVYLTKMGRTRKSSVSEADAELVRILTETGKKEELRVRLMEQLGDPSCGWRDQVRHNGAKSVLKSLFFRFHANFPSFITKRKKRNFVLG